MPASSGTSTIPRTEPAFWACRTPTAISAPPLTKTNDSRPARQFDERPYKWSQRWFDDPPIGTINFDGGRSPEIYVGNGEWQPLDHT